MPTLEKAVALAAEAHEGQTDKAGAPYLLHLLRVMMQMPSEEAMMAAVLHDLVEDTQHSFEGLRQRGFPERVVEAVEHLTRRDGETYEDFARRAGGHPLARRVKTADLADNMDVRRLDRLDDEGAERLRKYHQAWAHLTAGEPRLAATPASLHLNDHH